MKSKKKRNLKWKIRNKKWSLKLINDCIKQLDNMSQEESEKNFNSYIEQ